jgi:DUF2993 family protein
MLVAVVLIALVLVVVDRVAARVVAQRVATRIRTSQNLPATPSVAITGFPFLTQVIGGRYKAVSVTARDVRREDLQLSRVQVTLHGLRLPLRDLTNGTVRQIPVHQGTAAVSVSYEDLNSYLMPRHLSVAPDGAALRVTGRLQLPVVGQVSLSAPLRIATDGGGLTLVPEMVHSLAGALPASVRSVAVDLLTVRLPLRDLPFGVRLDSAHVGSEGIVVEASASDITLPAQAGAAADDVPGNREPVS